MTYIIPDHGPYVLGHGTPLPIARSASGFVSVPGTPGAKSLSELIELARQWHETATPEEKAAMWQAQRESFMRSIRESRENEDDTVVVCVPAQPPGAQEVCDMGVGCEEYGVCYADAHGEPGRCGKAPPELAPTDHWWAQRWIDKATPGEVAAMRALLFADGGK